MPATNASTQGRALYLHGGPGLTAEVERAWFGDALPVDWWDQPSPPANAADPLDWLVQAAAERLALRVHDDGGPVDVVSHSIGAVVAVRLAARCTTAVRTLTLVNPVFDLTDAFLRIARRLPATAVGSAVIPDVDSSRDTAFLDLAVALGAVPERFALYWAPGSSAVRARYEGLAPQGPRMDLDAFARVGTGIQAGRDALRRLVVRCPMRLLIGRFDPMCDEPLVSQWKTWWPDAEMCWVDGSHMSIYEQPPTAWLHR